MALYTFKNKTPDINDTVFIAPSAQIIGDVHIGALSSVWFQSVLRGDMDQIRIGEKTNIQDLCVCHADEGIPLNIGNGVTIGHRCVVHGCTIEDRCLIGMGAVVMNKAVIGKGSVVAAGAVVLENTVIPPYSLVAGTPAKVRQTHRSREEIDAAIAAMSDNYIKNAQIYRSEQFFDSARSPVP